MKPFAQYRPSQIHDPAQFIDRYHRVTYGLAAGMVSSFLWHPLDLLKTRIQNSPTPYTYMEKGRWIIRNQGWRVMYTGVSAAMYRQLFNTGPRLFSYHTLYDHHIRTHESRPTITQKVKIGLVSGLLGAFLGVPTEVVLVRMMAASAVIARTDDIKQLIKNPYTSFWNGFRRVIVEEGVRGLWRGGALTLSRSIINTMSQIGTYAFFRDYFMKSNVGENYKLHVITALCSSMVLSILSLPIDVVKTRYQVKKSDSGVTQKEIFLNLVRTRGWTFFWTKPFLPYYTRLTLHTLTSFFVIETIENAYHYDHTDHSGHSGHSDHTDHTHYSGPAGSPGSGASTCPRSCTR